MRVPVRVEDHNTEKVQNEEIQKATPLFFQIDFLDSVDSTNDYLKQYAELGEARMVVACAQTAGKGQYGRSWQSPAGQGLYVSYLLYPSIPLEESQRLNVISSLAVVSTLLQLDAGLPLHLKPPNDVYIRGKKVAGILTELASLGSRISWVIIGIGINLTQKKFSGELAQIATSLVLEGIASPHRLEICDSLTGWIIQYFEQLKEGLGEHLERQYQSYLQ